MSFQQLRSYGDWPSAWSLIRQTQGAGDQTWDPKIILLLTEGL